MWGELQMFCLAVFLALTQALHFHSLQPRLSCFTSLHFNPSIWVPNHHLPISPAHVWLLFVYIYIYIFFLAHCSMWFSSVTNDVVKMMDVYLPTVWAVRLFLTANQHHHHRHVLHKACSSSLIKSVTKSPLSRSLRRYRCLLTGGLSRKRETSGSREPTSLSAFNLD